MTRLVCLLVGHRWLKVPYEGADTADGFFVRCRRCGRSDDPRGTGVRGAAAFGAAPWSS